MQDFQQKCKPLNNFDDILEKELKNGHSKQDIKKAWDISSGDQNLFQQILQGMKNQSVIISPIHYQFNDDIQIAMEASLAMHKENRLDGKVRQDQTPCGLLNNGNTCYFNSLLQTYFFIYDFVSPIIESKLDNINLESIVDKRIANSIQLLKNLQNLFVLMIGSDRQFVDPKPVILSICDDFGKALPIGDQKDVGEFNNYFLSRIDEGITYIHKQQNKDKQSIQQNAYVQSVIQNPIFHQSQQNQSFIFQKSLLNKQQSVMVEESVLYKLFYGKLTPQIINGQASKDCQQEIFNFIQIDVNSKNLMEGLEKQFNQSVEYKNDFDQYEQAIKQYWIAQAPQILSFQIQRVEFNKQFLSFAKINSTFKFDKEIYIDRFLLSNQKIARQINIQNQQLNERLKKIDSELELLTQFNGNIQIIQNLENTLSFLKLQTPNLQSNPFFIENNNQTQSAINVISNYVQLLIKKRESLLQEKQDTEYKISQSYNCLKKQKYRLQSILMHEGSPDSGHYFAYIYNFDDQKWYVFNDIHVYEETEENILNYAFGDQSNFKSAYLIQYAKEDKVKQTQNQNERQKLFSTSDSVNYLKDSYGKLLSQNQRDFIKQDNVKLKQEVQLLQFNSQLEIIISIYEQFLEISNQKQLQYQNKQLQFKPPLIENFALYLKMKPDEKRFRWVILDYAIKKLIPTSNGLFGTNDDEQQIIIKQIIHDINKFGSNKPILPILSIQEFQAALDEYKNILKLQIMIVYILEQYNNNNLRETIIALHQYMKSAKQTSQQSFFYLIALQFKPLILLGIICKIFYGKNVSDSEIQVFKLIIAFQMQEHFLYNDKQLWSKQLQLLIGIAISTYSSNEKLTQDVLRPIIQNKKDIEMCVQLEIPSQNMDQQILSIQSIYLKKKFENDFNEYLFDTLTSLLQKFFNVKCISILYEKIEKSGTVLDRKEIFQIIEENPQNN